MRAAGVVVLFTQVVACGRIGFDFGSTPEDAPADVAVDTAADAEIDAPGYRAAAVRFETTGNDYLWTGFLANTNNSGRGTYSGWFHFTARDGQLQLLSCAQVVGIGGVVRAADNKFQLILQNCAAVPMLSMTTQATYTSGSGWIHLLASWDVGIGRADIYVNDVPDRAANPIVLPGAICYDSWRWGVGGVSSGTMDADVADIYANLGTFIDLDVEANRRKFSDASGKPIDLGPDCMGPTGAKPTGCFIGDVSTWSTNKGVGMGFNVDGDGLVAAPNSPND